MRISKLLVSLVVPATLASPGACSTAPETGRSQLFLISPDQEASMGFETFQEVKRKTPILRSGQPATEPQRVGLRNAGVAQVPNDQWELVLFQDADNASSFALPGGKVGVYRGILPIAQNDAGFATVIAHEIAHVTAHHGAERMSQSLLIQLGGTALSAVLGADGGITRDVALQAYNLGTTVGVALPFFSSVFFVATTVT